MITEIMAQIRDDIGIAFTPMVQVIEYDGFLKVDSALSNELIISLRFIGVAPATIATGTKETIATTELGILIRKRLSEGSFDTVIDAAEYISAWLKWRRFDDVKISPRGAQLKSIQSASRDFGMPVLEVRFQINILLEDTPFIGVSTNRPVDRPNEVIGGPFQTAFILDYE